MSDNATLPGAACRTCGRTGHKLRRQLCGACYYRLYRHGAPLPPRVVRPVSATVYRDAGPIAPLHQADPLTRLPIPPMVRCGGCADVPACDRAARADVGYCWRCQQARAPGVAA